MRHPELAGCWAKVDRAGEHRQQLDLAMQEWLDTKPHSFVTEFEPETGQHIVRLKTAPVVPLRLGAILSDVVHNLRAALDFMVYRLAVSESGEDPPPRHDKLGFPIAETTDKFDRKEKYNRGDLSDAVWAGLKRFQPFSTHPHDPTESALWYLEEMDIIGKHRELPITTTSIGERLVFLGTDPPGVHLALGGLHPPWPLEDNAEFLTYTAPVPGKVTVNFDASFVVTFGNGHGLPHGHPVGEVLDTLRENVETVLNIVGDVP